MAMNKKVTVTLDSGADYKRMRKLEVEGLIEITMVNFENGRENKRAKVKQNPVAVWGQTNWGESVYASEEDLVFEQLKKLLGNNHIKDCIQLEAHHTSGRDYFVSEDKDDILSRKEELEKLFGIKVLAPEELEILVKPL
jgi:hypothetical protein